MKRMNKQKGFTIIELVVVILLLGILTATALPRFMDVTDEAHDAVVNGVLAGLSTSSGLFRAQWYAEGQPDTVAEYGLGANSLGYAFGSLESTISSAECLQVFTTFLQAAGRPTITTLSNGAGALNETNFSEIEEAFIARADDEDPICRYGYAGQFKDAADGNNPVIEYDAATGVFSLATAEL